MLKLPKAWFPYRCICRICRTKKIHRTDITLNLPYKCSIQKKRQIQLVVRDRMNSLCAMNFFRTTDTTDTTIWKPGLIPKYLLRPITTTAGSAMNQSEFLAITSTVLKARETSPSGVQGFATHWLKTGATFLAQLQNVATAIVQLLSTII